MSAVGRRTKGALIKGLRVLGKLCFVLLLIVVASVGNAQEEIKTFDQFMAKAQSIALEDRHQHVDAWKASLPFFKVGSSISDYDKGFAHHGFSKIFSVNDRLRTRALSIRGESIGACRYFFLDIENFASFFTHWMTEQSVV